MKRKIKAIKERLSNWWSDIVNRIMLLAALIGILIGGTIGFIISPVEHLTETEINECEQIFNKIFEDGEIKPINDEIKSSANKNGYNVSIDYIKSIVTFSFENELKENLLFDISTKGKNSKKIDSTSAETNRILIIILGNLLGFLIGIFAIGFIICGAIILYEKIVYFIRRAKKNKKKRKFSIVKSSNTDE